MDLVFPLQLIAEYREYVWGGHRLRPGQRTAEAWVIYENDRIATGPLAGRTLAEVAAEAPLGLLGERVLARSGVRFPLLVKLLDSLQWMSLQVHPDDALAAALEGPGNLGKTEAWYVLDAEPGAQFVAGIRPGTTAEALADAIRNGSILDLVQYRDVHPGDAVLMPARTIHALGAGLLIYEVQQTSDFTYRVFDWNRPPVPGRVLHIEKSVAATDPAAVPSMRPAIDGGDGARTLLAACPFFTLELLAGGGPIGLDTAGQTFHALTVIEGTAEVVTGGSGASLVLKQYESAVVPAACGSYQLNPGVGGKVLKASVEA